MVRAVSGWKKRLETGRKFFNLFGSREAFLRGGLTKADLKVDGKVPDDKEKLMMFVKVESRSSINLRRSNVGRGSIEQEADYSVGLNAFKVIHSFFYI